MTDTQAQASTKKRKPRAKAQVELPQPVEDTNSTPDFQAELESLAHLAVDRSSYAPKNNYPETPSHLPPQMPTSKLPPQASVPYVNQDQNFYPVVTKGFVQSVMSITDLDMNVADDLLRDLLTALISREDAKSASQKQRLTILALTQIAEDFWPLFGDKK